MFAPSFELRKPRDTHSIISYSSNGPQSNKSKKTNQLAKVKTEPSQSANLMENYYYPCDEVINFEKTLIKHSIVWDYAI